MTNHKPKIDWPGIESDWLKSDMSIRKMADWYQVSESAIRKKAKEQGWPDRPPKKVDPVRTYAEPRTEPVMIAGIDATDPDQIVGRGHNLIFRLLEELDATTTHHAELADMIEAHEDDPRRRAAMMKAIELPGRANVVKALATAFKTWNEARAPEGKKAQRQANAERSSSAGKFSVPTAPKLVVNNGQ